MEINPTHLIFDLGIIGFLAVLYYGYVVWRDERLDAEDEKYDRIRGETHA